MLTTHHATTVQIVINQRKSRGHLPFTRFGPKFAQGYIIPSNFSFHSSSGENKRSCRLMAAGRQQFCGDTVNMFAHEDQNFQWSRAYFYYSSHSAQNEVIWTSGIARAGCVPEVFDCKEVVSWCAEKYIPGQRIIPLRDHSPVSLSPQVFREMLKLSKPTLTFRGQDCKQFLEKHDNGMDILADFLEDPTTVPEDITRLQVSSFRNPFREIAWLFTRITGQASTTSISHIIIYILYFTVKEQYIFDWGKLISIELCSQLSRFKESNKFYMSSYLIFAIVHCCPFPKLSLSNKINCGFDPVTFWYEALWRHKASHCFYEVFNGFVSVFKDLLLGKDAPRMSGHATKFLNRKGTLEQEENHSVLMVFGSKENPAFLPCHIMDKMFVAEIARQYNHWLHFFHDKKKKQFIPLPWKVGDFVCRNINKIDEFAAHFKKLNLTYAERLKGFDPNGIFREHLLVVGFNTSFIHRHLTQDRTVSTTILLLSIATQRHCKARLNCTDNMEKYLVRRVPSPPPTLPRARHHGASLRRSTPVRKQPRNLRTEEEIRTLLA
jgi:hypothetical protein